MAQVTLPYTLTAGTPENVNNLVSNLNALVTGVNTIDTAQIATGAVTTTQILDGTVATADIANGAITSAKLASGVGGTALVVGSVSAATQRSTTSAALVDVTGASFSLTIASNSTTYLAVNAEISSSIPLDVLVAVVAGSAKAGAYVTNAATPDTFVIHSSNSPAAPTYATFSKVSAINALPSALTGTGSQTIKVQFADSLGAFSSTAYIKNVYLSAVNIPL